jgi:hypothetical protein
VPALESTEIGGVELSDSQTPVLDNEECPSVVESLEDLDEVGTFGDDCWFEETIAATTLGSTELDNVLAGDFRYKALIG